MRSSYWFVPALLSLGAVVAFVILALLDKNLDTDAITDIPGLGANHPDGARAVLQTIGSSMLGVAGVTFSITIAAVAFATSNYGPRILQQFMQDRGNQFTLGTFIATFLYCVLALRLVLDAGPGEDAEAYVPQITLLGGLTFGLASLCVLIYFLHHVPASIDIGNVIARIGGELTERLGEAQGGYGGPASEGESATPAEPLEPGAAHPLVAERSAYLQQVDRAQLVHLAAEHDLRIDLVVRPGDFVWPGALVARVVPGGLPPRLEAGIRGCLVWGSRRTPSQDPLFLADELVEIGARALSPGINDPFTCMSCVDWLVSAAERFAASPRNTCGAWCDDAGTIRVQVEALDFPELLERGLGSLRPYIAANLTATVHTLGILARLRVSLPRHAQRSAIDALARELLASAQERAVCGPDRAQLARVAELLEAPVDRRALVPA
ncbi:MAG: DUF2254 domain-containing protein [Planctomycetota bacterium]